MTSVSEEKKFNRIITVISIVIPVVVALLFTVKIPNVARPMVERDILNMCITLF